MWEGLVRVLEDFTASKENKLCSSSHANPGCDALGEAAHLKQISTDLGTPGVKNLALKRPIFDWFQEDQTPFNN